MKLRLDVYDKSVRELFAKIERHAPELRKRILTAIAERVVEKTKREKLSGQVLGRKTGSLRQSVNRVVLGGTAEVFVDRNRAIYGAIHEFGGTIKPKKGLYLRFKGSRGWATVKQVKMPARPYLWPTLRDYMNGREWLDLAEQIIKQEMRKNGAAT